MKFYKVLGITALCVVLIGCIQTQGNGIEGTWHTTSIYGSIYMDDSNLLIVKSDNTFTLVNQNSSGSHDMGSGNWFKINDSAFIFSVTSGQYYQDHCTTYNHVGDNVITTINPEFNLTLIKVDDHNMYTMAPNVLNKNPYKVDWVKK